ncbi:hypothetical protein Q9R08_19275 [Microbacterium sp. QXD-8]|uniref:Integral membrane protein n=1 Tax=Microbacterium psychrotolerans TaxID=3068321 RepID=A0ABU0Z9E9_9MICO|nr:hypothetical protein [Microbacterium sp. QXD-8]MDQ7880141.1 hypothetical protein [Microbacterium sp. QXD-8]
MTDLTAADETAELRARLDALEAENARLRAETPPPPPASTEKALGNRWRAFLSALCIVVATILVPVSIVAAWARVELVDETRFVETFAPLADDPQVQAMVADQVTVAIEDSLDLEGLTNDLFDGIQQLDLPPRALAALDLLRAPAAQGLQNLVDTTVTRLVQSEAFADVWDTALRASHRSLQAVAAGGTSSGAVVIEANGEVGIQLAPIIEEVKKRLVDRGIGFAESIPVIDKTIVVAQSDALTVVGTVYNLAVAAGWWTPIIALVLFLAGILIARRRSTAVLGTGVGIALGAGVLAIGLGIGGSILALSAPSLGVPAGALASMYEQITAAMRDTAVVLTLLGIVIAVIAWMSGRWRGARAARGGVASVNAGVRVALLKRGVDTGRFGGWLYAQRILVRIVLGALAIVWLMLLRPLSVGEVFLVLVVWLVVWWVFELLQRRPEEAAAALLADEAAAAAAAESTPVVDTEADTVVIVDDPADPDADTLVIETDAATDAAAASGSKKRS